MQTPLAQPVARSQTDWPNLVLHTIWPGSEQLNGFCANYVHDAKVLQHWHRTLADWPVHAVIGAWRTYSQYVHDEMWVPVSNTEPDTLFDRYLQDVAHAYARAWSVEPAQAGQHNEKLARVLRSTWYEQIKNQPKGLWVLVDLNATAASALMIALAQTLGSHLRGPIYRVRDQEQNEQTRLFDPHDFKASTIEATDDSPASPPVYAHEALARASNLPSAALVLDDDLGIAANAKTSLSIAAQGRCVIGRLAMGRAVSAYEYLADLASCMPDNDLVGLQRLSVIDVNSGQCISWPL